MDIIFGNLLIGIGQILHLILSTYVFLLFGRVIISWVNADIHNPIVRFLVVSTDPPLYQIRRYLPRIPGPIDWSPMILLAVVYFLESFLVVSIMEFGARIKMMGL